MRRPISTGLVALVFWGCLSVFFAAPAAATGVDISLESDPESSTATNGIAVTLFNLDTGGGYPGRTGIDGTARFPNVRPGRYQITIEGEGLAHIEYREIKGRSVSRTYKTKDLANVPLGGRSIASLETLLDIGEQAVEDGNRERFEAATARITALRDLHVTALAQLEKIDPNKRQTARRNEHRKVIDRCNTALKTDSTSIMWPSPAIAPGSNAGESDLLLGDWTINPIPIKNTEDCGQVFQTGSMTVAEKVGPGHWRGTYAFRWDTSKADPACRFKFSKSGTATVDLYVDGATVTVKYSNTGQNTFADDKLTLNGNVLNGQDATGQVVTYTRK